METKQILKKYPLAKTIESMPLMHEAGKYAKGFPEGIIVHFTAGWQNSKAADTISYANQNGYRFFFIDEEGQVWQQFCLSGWGSHAGKSKCPVTGRESVSRYYVGIEVACAGKLEDKDGDGDRDDTWFKQMNITHDKIRTGGHLISEHLINASPVDGIIPGLSIHDICRWRVKINPWHVYTYRG